MRWLLSRERLRRKNGRRLFFTIIKMCPRATRLKINRLGFVNEPRLIEFRLLH